MSIRQIITGCGILITVIAVAFMITNNSHAQPGTDIDPVISLSYLESSLEYSPLYLEGGEDFTVTPGRGVVLLDGSCRMSMPSEGRSWIMDISDGVAYTDPIEMMPGHMYIPLSDDNDSAIFTIQTWRSSTIALPGGSGR